MQMKMPGPNQFGLFSLEERGQPFADARQAMDALLRWVKWTLLAALQRRRARLVPAASILEEDLRQAEAGLAASLAVPDGQPAADPQALKDYAQIVNRLALSPDLLQTPFLRLCGRLDLDAFGLFCAVAAVACYAQSQVQRAFALAGAGMGCTLETCGEAFFDGGASLADMAACRDKLAQLLPLEEAETLGACKLAADARLFQLFTQGKEEVAQGVSRFCWDTPLEQPATLDACGQRLMDRPPEALSEIVNLYGPPRSGRRTLARGYGQRHQRDVLFLEAGELEGPIKLSWALWYARRELLLRPGLLCICGLDQRRLDDSFRLLADSAPLLLVSEQRLQLNAAYITSESVPIALPGQARRRELWAACLGSAAREIDLWPVASQFRLSAGLIRQAAASALRRSGGGPVSQAMLEACAGEQVRHTLGDLADQGQDGYRLTDLKLPTASEDMLRQAIDQVRWRHRVQEEWGFGDRLGYGRGLALLFYGPPGTGKTMAASVVANELGLRLYRVDLARVVDKYVGETEKNLGRLFDQAARTNAVLFFDEADTLFGRRGENGSAQERGFNLEIGYLLQRMERYEGVTILATNLAGNLDDAFTRRIRFKVEFPFPTAQVRLKIWQGVFPPRTPVGADVDLPFLAERFELSGGNIQNAALNAAYLAAAQGKACVDMAAILYCVRQEIVKAGNAFYLSALEQYQSLMDA